MSRQLLRQILRFQMRILAKHAKVFVPGDDRDFHNIQSTFEESSCCLMAQVVKMKIFDSGTARSTNERFLDRFRRDCRKQISLAAAGKGGEYAYRING